MGATDYKTLCEEIFGTTDEDEIRRLVAAWTRKNARNAGRKRALSLADKDEVDTMRHKGAAIQDIATHFSVSRPVISQYLNERPSKDFTLRIDFRLKDKTCTVIYVDFEHEVIEIQNRTDDVLHRAFGVNEHPTWNDFEQFLEARCFPRSRGYAKMIIRGLGVNGYDPLEIAEATDGRTAEDEMYLTFRSFPKKVKAYA